MSEASGADGASDRVEVESHEPEARPDYAEKVAFFGHLAYRVPELREPLAKHLMATQGELLPHLFMADILDWLLEEGSKGASTQLRLALDVLDQGFTAGSDGLKSLLVVSFIEALPGFDGTPDDASGRGAALRPFFGPTLGVVLAEVEAQRKRGARPLG